MCDVMGTIPVSAPAHERQPALAERYSARASERVHVVRHDARLRALDLTIALVAGVMLLPVIALIAMCVLVSSGRPVLYRGGRVGRGGRIFTMYKFRTLRPDAEQRLGPYMGAELDALTPTEQTRIGAALRRLQLDELPQLFNVLRGDMSIVGPRPIRPVFFEQLCEQIPQYWQRLVVRPGMTGLAQLRITRDMTWAEKLSHDLEFIADRSVALYLRIVVDTIARFFTRAVGRRS